MTATVPDVERFLALAARLQADDPRLSAIQAGLLAAVSLDIAHDSRTFARVLGLAHALVLRDLDALAERGGLLCIEKRDSRTMRTHYTSLTGLEEQGSIRPDRDEL